MPFGVRNSLDDILRRMGIGSYETADGQKISKEMLPPEAQQAVDYYAGPRTAVSQGIGDNSARAYKEYQGVINNIYNPKTRDAMLKAVGPYGQYPQASTALEDFDQAQGMDQMMNEITNALAKRKIRATRSR